MAPMTGRLAEPIAMNAPGFGKQLGGMIGMGFGAEILYSFVIIVCSLMIYFGTKEFYELSNHKGIKYFRRTFLFFAIAYFFRSFIKIILLAFGRDEIRTILPFVGSITLFLFLYFSIMAIFYLLYSVMYKKWESKNGLLMFHGIALITAFALAMFGFSLQVHLFVNILLLLFIVVVAYQAYHQSQKKRSLNLYVIYVLLMVFWIIQIIDILIPNFVQEVQLFIYLASMGIFLAILYKVIKQVGSA